MLNVLTIFVIAPLVLLVLVGVLLSAYDIKKDKSAKLWIAGCVSLAIGYVFAALRTLNQGNQSFALSNIMTLLGVILTFMAFEKLLNGRDRSVPWAVGASIVFGEGLALLVATPLESSIGVVVGVVFGLVHLYFVYQLSRLSKDSNPYIRVLIAISSIHGVLWLVRGGTGLLVGFHLISSQALTNFAFVIVFVLLSTARQLIYLILRVSATSTERKQLAELNDEKNKLITSLLKVNKTVATGALSATVAHEINQPLTAIKLTLADMRAQFDEETINRTELKKNLEWLESDVDRAADTVRTLRTIFQEKSVVSECCSLKELMEFVLNLSSYDLNKRAIHVTQEYLDPCMVNVNGSELRQVLINIVANSVDALEMSNCSDKQIYVKLQRVGAHACLHISDNGPGVLPEHQIEIFELLQTHKPQGSGLGLWLCRQLLDRHQGSIEYQTSAEGGAEFIIKLPAA